MSYGVENGPFPLGSCTMKYNPKFTEDVAALPEAATHPDRAEGTVQGTLELQYRLQEYLAAIGGMHSVTLQPPAGAAGEFTGHPRGESVPRAPRRGRSDRDRRPRERARDELRDARRSRATTSSNSRAPTMAESTSRRSGRR